MSKIMLLICFSMIANHFYGQNVAVNNTAASADPSAILDVSSAGKGILVPRMSTSGITSIINPAKGLLVYDSVKNQLMVNMGSVTVPNWQTIVFNSGWSLGGNSGFNPATSFIGTADNSPLNFRTNNLYSGQLNPITGNIFFGLRAGLSNTSGYSNVALGTNSMIANTVRSNLVAIGDSALYFNGVGAVGSTEATGNTAIGSKSLYKNTRGFFSTAIGTNTLYNNTTGERNTASGAYALFSNTTGNQNTASGLYSLNQNTDGSFNTATGVNSLQANVHGNYNAAFGVNTMFSNTSGSYNTAAGLNALQQNTTGSNNTATGAAALQNNNGNSNSAHGMYALYLNTTGSQNTANGYAALFSNITGSYNTANGSAALNYATGSYNTATGAYAMYYTTTGTRNTANGHAALFSNLDGIDNLASGYEALYANTSGRFNAAIGNGALSSNTTGFDNIALGHQSLNLNKHGINNTSLGSHSLYNDTSQNNTAVGAYSLYTKVAGEGNTVIGAHAGDNLTAAHSTTIIGAEGLSSLHGISFYNTMVGYGTLSGPAQTCSNNVCVGYSAGHCSPCAQDNGNGGTVDFCTFIGSQTSTYPTIDYDYHITNSTAIGYGTQVNQDNKVIIGNQFVTSIGGFSGWSTFSDGRFKKNVSEDVKGLEFILRLRPVTYNLDLHSLGQRIKFPMEDEKSFSYSREQVRYSGFIAQEVEKLSSEIGFDFSGIDKPQSENGQYALRYAEFVVPLVKAVQEQQQQIKTLKKENAEIKAQLQKLLDLVSKR